jgi:hypothetical protein
MLIVADLDAKSWSITGESGSFFANIEIGFASSQDGPVVFDNLSFGYAVLDGGNELKSDSFPDDGVVYLSSDQDYVVADVVNDLTPEKEYKIAVWAVNAGERFESLLSFTTPRLPQPYPSWVYDEETKMWSAPVAPPADGEDYFWNEEELSWELHSYSD